MVHFSFPSLAALGGAAALFITTSHGLPVLERDNGNNSFSKPFGIDRNNTRPLRLNDILPKTTILSSEDLAINTATSFPPLNIGSGPVEKRYINTPDDRYLWTRGGAPYKRVGKLSWSNGVFCSAALIGPRHVLTAKHCWIDDPNVSGTFTPGYDRGAPLGSAQVTNGYMNSIEWGTPCGWKGDWAVVVINKRLGDKLGYFGVKLPEQSKSLQDRKIFYHQGYPGDLSNGERPYRVDGNPIPSKGPQKQFNCDATGPFYSDTDCAGGQSGGPFWQRSGNQNYIWGTLSVTGVGGDGSNRAWSGWASGNEMMAAIGLAKKQFP